MQYTAIKDSGTARFNVVSSITTMKVREISCPPWSKGIRLVLIAHSTVEI